MILSPSIPLFLLGIVKRANLTSACKNCPLARSNFPARSFDYPLDSVLSVSVKPETISHVRLYDRPGKWEQVTPTPHNNRNVHLTLCGSATSIIRIWKYEGKAIMTPSYLITIARWIVSDIFKRLTLARLLRSGSKSEDNSSKRVLTQCQFIQQTKQKNKTDLLQTDRCPLRSPYTFRGVSRPSDVARPV